MGCRWLIGGAAVLLVLVVGGPLWAQGNLWEPIREQAKALLAEAGYDWEGRPQRGLTYQEEKAYREAEQRYYDLVQQNAEPVYFDEVVVLGQQYASTELPESKEANVIGSDAWYRRNRERDFLLKMRYLANAKIMAGMEPALQKEVFGDFGIKYFTGQPTPIMAITAIGTSGDPRTYDQLQRIAEQLVADSAEYDPYGWHYCVQYLATDPGRDRLSGLETTLEALLAEENKIANDEALPGPTQGEARSRMWTIRFYLGGIQRGIKVRQLADRMRPEQREAFFDFYCRVIAPLPFLPMRGARKAWSDISYFPDVFQPRPGDKQFYLPFLLHCGDLSREVRCVAELFKLEKTPFAVEQIKQLAESDARHARVAQEILDHWENPPSEDDRLLRMKLP